MQNFLLLLSISFEHLNTIKDIRRELHRLDERCIPDQPVLIWVLSLNFFWLIMVFKTLLLNRTSKLKSFLISEQLAFNFLGKRPKTILKITLSLAKPKFSPHESFIKKNGTYFCTIAIEFTGLH